MKPRNNVYLFLPLFFCVEAAKILGVFPTPSFSHQVVFRPLMLELAKRGHHVTVITTHPMFEKGGAPDNFKEIDFRKESKVWNIPKPTLSNEKIHEYIKNIMELMTYIFNKHLEINEVSNIINNKSVNFDLVIVESWFRPALAFAHRFNVPIIKFASVGAIFNEYILIGGSEHPLLYFAPSMKKILNLTFWDQISELYNRWSFLNMHESLEDSENKGLRNYFGSDMPTLTELSDKVGMIMLSIHRMCDMCRPNPINLITVGAIHIHPGKELPEDLKLFLDTSVYGIIYVSFGTNCVTSQVPPKQVEAMVNVLSRLPYDVLWKCTDKELPRRPKNIRISEWLPQQDLLKHPNVKLFVTQGGLQSIEEAIAGGVPLLGIPVNADQFYNVDNVIRLNCGLHLPIQTFTEDEFEDKIDILIKDDRYRNNVVQLRTLLYDTPQSPLQRAVWWTEHVLRHGARHLRAPAHNMHWTEYHEIELFTIVIFSVLLITIFFVFIIKKSCIFIWKIFVICSVTLFKRHNNNMETNKVKET